MAEKFCPVCKKKNAADATVCVFCGSPLEHGQGEPVTTRNVATDALILSQAVEETLKEGIEAPKQGIAIYVKDYARPIEVREEKEFILGRKLPDDKEEAIVDLMPFGAYEYGVSRRHAMIKETESGYEITDLASTNGTWVNKQRLIPNKPLPLTNAAQIRLGRMYLFVIFQKIEKKK
jgi:hypothetical protein